MMWDVMDELVRNVSLGLAVGLAGGFVVGLFNSVVEGFTAGLVRGVRKGVLIGLASGLGIGLFEVFVRSSSRFVVKFAIDAWDYIGKMSGSALG